ncbi:restriction endonuclease subunit S [Acinetobacter sp. CIP 102136]|uniref:restriction endonuclease subunit S n=1 Tax=Acinetobacter sp. CIP 102136 TaxID=1144665 RepID=UPI0002CFF211|nr:restriction endonuclease subunit S [Acinetobacter sp. CIP 102136]ENX21437.1 hypothetical protein F893_01717 [Acinetobacter sp. CIP 102136]
MLFKFPDPPLYIISIDDLYISIAGTIGLVGSIPDCLDGANLTENAAKICNLQGIERPYLKYVLNSQIAIDQFDDKVTSSGQPKLALFRIRDCRFPYPPLAEQQEIVRQLDVMFAQVEQIKARLDAIPAILKKFRQSVLADAVSGKLINQDFSSLGFLKLESLILDSGNGLSKRKGDSGNEVTVLRLADFKDAQRVFGNERSILLTEKELLKYKLLQNDILVVRVNGSVDIAGKFILHKDNEKDEAYCDHFIRLRIDQQKLLPEYLLYIANEGSGRDYLVNSLSTSAGQNTINQASIKGLQLRVPEIKYQDMIIQTVEKLFKHSFKIEETVLSAQKRVNLLTQSILAKAFSGELTAEWREQHQELITGINSAESLLAKIKAEREASKPAKKTRKKKEV